MEMTKENPKVSVCVVTYNQEKYIRQCLQSIVDQVTDFEFEVIVSDDCSTDGTNAIVQEFAEKYPGIVKPIFHKKNIGAFKNYVFVHNQASGKYSAHIDGDDYWLPAKLKEQVSFIEKNSACVAVYSNAIVVEGDNRLLGYFNNSIKKIFDINFLIEKGNYLCHSSLIYKASLRDQIFSIKGDFIDYHIHLRLGEIGLLGYIDKYLVAYRSDSTGSVIKNDNKYIRELYLNAILDANLKNIKTSSLKSSLVEFIAEAMHYEFMYGTFSSYKNWLRIIKLGTPTNIVFLQISACHLFAKYAIKKIKFKIKKIFLKSKKNNHIFHPR